MAESAHRSATFTQPPSWLERKAAATTRLTSQPSRNVGHTGRPVSIARRKSRASVRVAKKIGMRYEREVMFEGYTHPDHLYVIER